MKHPDMIAAMNLEIDTFRRMTVYKEVLLSYLPVGTNKTSTRWVLSAKTKPNGSTKCKAKLVARGYEDTEKDNVNRDSPTASNAFRRFVLHLLTEKQ